MLPSAAMIWLLSVFLSISALSGANAQMNEPAESLMKYSRDLVVQTPIDLKNLASFREKGKRYRGTIITYSKGDRLVAQPSYLVRIQLNGFSQCAIWYKDEVNSGAVKTGENQETGRVMDELPRGSILRVTSAVKNKIWGMYEGDVSFKYDAYLATGEKVGSGNLECWAGVLTGTFRLKNLVYQLSPHIRLANPIR
jgi:hypothetical protein